MVQIPEKVILNEVGKNKICYDVNFSTGDIELIEIDNIRYKIISPLLLERVDTWKFDEAGNQDPVTVEKEEIPLGKLFHHHFHTLDKTQAELIASIVKETIELTKESLALKIATMIQRL